MWILLTIAIQTVACQGDIDGGRARGSGPSIWTPGAGVAQPGVPGVGADQATRQADDAMRAQNGALFDVALRYFPGDAPAGGRKRLFRLTRTQLDLTTSALLPAHYTTAVADAMPGDPLQTNYEYSDNLSFNAANFTPYTTWVDALATSVRANPASIVSCAATGNNATCLNEQARGFVTRAFRGVVTAAQLDRYSAFFMTGVGTVGLPAATGDLVALALTSPSYVFRDEVQTDASGRLLPAHQLQNISYTLADAPPEALGLSPANAAVQLATPDAMQRTIDQVLATPQARQKLLRFFLAWLEVKEPDEFTIDAGVFPEFTPQVAAAAVEETRAFLNLRLSAPAPKLSEITQATQSIVSQPLAFIYGSSTSSSATTPVNLDPTQRLGIFTQPGVIASHSGPTTTRLVKRGVFFTRKVMCLPLGSPPDDVDTTVPPSAGATERQRIETVTAAARCQGCHAFINPFGFMQENYDPIGRWRTTDEGMPIDPSMTVSFLDEGPLTATTPVEALRALTSSFRFQQCFARQLFRFYMGREEAAGDDPVLRQMFFGFANQGAQDILPMLRMLATSVSFAQRSEAP